MELLETRPERKEDGRTHFSASSCQRTRSESGLTTKTFTAHRSNLALSTLPTSSRPLMLVTTLHRRPKSSTTTSVNHFDPPLLSRTLEVSSVQTLSSEQDPAQDLHIDHQGYQSGHEGNQHGKQTERIDFEKLRGREEGEDVGTAEESEGDEEPETEKKSQLEVRG